MGEHGPVRWTELTAVLRSVDDTGDRALDEGPAREGLAAFAERRAPRHG